MAWRFKVSKYKNAAPKFLKKEETIQGLPVSDVTQSCGNHIKSSCVYMAFNVDAGGGGGIGFLPLFASGRQDNQVPILLAHSDVVTDFDFSPFDDYLLASCSSDNNVKIWLLPEETAESPVDSSPVLTAPVFERQVENVLWHPSANGILGITSNTSLKIFDINKGGCSEVFDFSSHGDQVQSLSWQSDGSLVVTSCKDKKIRVIDSRAGTVVQEGQGHQNVKDSRVLWLPGRNYILSTGFTQSRTREVRVWDPRSIFSSLTSLDIGSSTGTIMPFYDQDTSMTFLVGKGDTSINYLEFTEKDPFLTEASIDRVDQVKGACLVPKRAMNLMEGEVNRLLVLCKGTILPIPYIVPRKSYREFHSDLYPDTHDGVPSMNGTEWLQGKTAQPALVKLQPGKKHIHRGRRGCLILGTEPKSECGASSKVSTTISSPQTVEQNDPVTSIKPEPIAKMSSPSAKKEETEEKEKDKKEPMIVKPTKVFSGVRQSKVRHIQGQVLHPSCFITNVRNVCKTVPGESDMFAANVARCAVPLGGAGGCMQVFEFSTASRLPDVGVPVIQNGSKVMDFKWDPFDDSRLVVVLDNARICVWKIPSDGVTESMEEPEFILRGHMEKIYFVQFHPLASDLIVTAAYDMTVRMWDLKEQKEVLQLEGHQDQVFCLSWSSDGKKCTTVCKDGKVYIFEPRKSTSPLKEGKGPEGSRGARVVWALNDKFLLITGFNRTSVQSIYVYGTDNLEVLHEVSLATSPAILIPYYDPDCSVLFVTSRGDRTLYMYEVSEEKPHLFECSNFRMEGLHQGVSFLPKYVCDAKKVEVDKAWRLTNSSVECVSFTVPRVKMEYFQDDLFPDTKMTWKPTLTAAEWLAGHDKTPGTLSMKPSDMTPMSQAPVEAPKTKKFESYNAQTYKSDEQRKEELLSAVTGKLEIKNEPLPQDLAEGVDDDEWDD